MKKDELEYLKRHAESATKLKTLPSDCEVAGAVRMLMRTDFNHEAVCVMARDKIAVLSVENVALKERVERLEEAITIAQNRLDNYANLANAGKAESSGREFSRQIWAAFSNLREELGIKEEA